MIEFMGKQLKKGILMHNAISELSMEEEMAFQLIITNLHIG